MILLLYMIMMMMLNMKLNDMTKIVSLSHALAMRLVFY